MANIKLVYLYRDGGNNKRWGEEVFENSANISIEKIKNLIIKRLTGETWFYASEWGLPDLHFETWDDQLDHTFHEFDSVGETNNQPTDSRTIEMFLSLI